MGIAKFWQSSSSGATFAPSRRNLVAPGSTAFPCWVGTYIHKGGLIPRKGTGAPVHRCTGTHVHQYTGIPVYWHSDTPGHQYTGTPKRRHNGTLEHRGTGTLMPW